MTWARNIFWVVAVFFMGRESVQVGWREFALGQVFILTLVAVVTAIWFLVNRIERRFKSKRRGAAMTFTQRVTGEQITTPVRFCPKCGTHLTRGAYSHVDTCQGSAS